MTSDDTIRMARDVHLELLSSGRGMDLWHDDALVRDVQEFCSRFAAMVADAERQACIDIVTHHGGSVEIEAAIRQRGEA